MITLAQVSADGRQLSPIPVPGTVNQLLSERDREIAIRALRFNENLRTTVVAAAAIQQMAEQVALPAGPGLGIVLATNHGDQDVLSERIDLFSKLHNEGQKAQDEMFRAIAYFPNGRVLSSLADISGARGSLVTVPAVGGQAEQIAQILLCGGRAEQILLVRAEATDTSERAWANVRLLTLNKPISSAQPKPTIGIADWCWVDPAGSHTDMAQRAIHLLMDRAPSTRTVLIVTSLLGSAGEKLFNQMKAAMTAPDLVTTMHNEATKANFSEVYTVVGSAGGSMIGLALAQDLFAQDRADQIVLCGVDLVGGPLESALTLLRCNDLPGMRGGAAALLLLPAEQISSKRKITGVHLFGPTIRRGRPLEPGILQDLAPLEPNEVILSGLTEFELTAAQTLVPKLWLATPPLRSWINQRHLNCDLLKLLTELTSATTILAVHVMGGSGLITVS
jgi:hypothetical protein